MQIIKNLDTLPSLATQSQEFVIVRLKSQVQKNKRKVKCVYFLYFSIMINHKLLDHVLVVENLGSKLSHWRGPLCRVLFTHVNFMFGHMQINGIERKII